MIAYLREVCLSFALPTLMPMLFPMKRTIEKGTETGRERENGDGQFSPIM